MSIEKIISIKNLIEDTEKYLDSNSFATDILNKYELLENVVLAEEEQVAFDREKRALKNLIIQHIVFVISDVLVPKIKEGVLQLPSQALTTWQVYANDFVEDTTYLRLSNEIEQAKEFIDLRKTIEESILFISAAEDKFREDVDHQMHIESQELLRQQSRVNAKIEKSIKNLSDSEQFDLNKQVEDYRQRFLRFARKVEAINLQLSAANTLLISGEYQKALDLYQSCEGPFALATSIDFDYINGVFIDNKVQQNVSKEKAIEVTTNRWRIYSEYKYGDYAETLGKHLPEDTVSGKITEDPYEIKAKWEDNISKNLMPLDKITDIDVKQLVQNFNANLNKIIKRYDNYELDLRQKSQDPDYISRYRKLLDFKNIIDSQIPLAAIINEWQLKLNESKELVGDSLRHKIEYFRKKFVSSPEDVWQEIRQIINRVDRNDFPDYYHSLERISEVSEKISETISKIDKMINPQEILDFIVKIEERLKPDLELPNILREKQKTYHSLLNPMLTADELIRKASAVKDNLDHCEDFGLADIESLKNDIDLWIDSINQRPDQAKLANVKSRLEKLSGFQSLLEEVISFIHIQTMMAQSSPDIRRLKQRLDNIQTPQLLERLEDVRKKVHGWQRDDSLIEQRLIKIKTRISNGLMPDLLSAYFDLRDLYERPSLRKAEMDQLLEDLIVLINDGRRGYLEQMNAGEVDQAGLENLIKFFDIEIPGTNELEEYKRSILTLKAEKAEKSLNWYEAFLNWQKILKINENDEEIQARVIACLKIFVLEKSVKEDFASIKHFLAKFGDDLEILCINLFQKKAEFQQTLSHIDKLNDTLMTDLERSINDIRNHFSIKENEQQESSDVSIQNSIFTLYLQRPEVAQIIGKFDEKFGHNQIRDELELFRDICGKMNIIVQKMNLENPVNEFYYGRKLVDLHITEETLPDIGRKLFLKLWNSLRLKLLAKVA